MRAESRETKFKFKTRVLSMTYAQFKVLAIQLQT